MRFYFFIENDDDEDQWLPVEGRFIHLTNNMTERGKEYNRRIKSNTKVYRFPYEHACYMHSASISEDYLILSEIPFHFNTFNAIWNSIAGGTVTDMFKWNGATMPTYFRIISLDTGEQVARIPGPAFFTFHHINSYQSKDNPKKIIVNICAFDDARIRVGEGEDLLLFSTLTLTIIIQTSKIKVNVITKQNHFLSF